ncbi:DNA cytosine methyltransferase [Paenibacillus sp. Y412MC10]|uniref:DNA cytosine methyltransferase n=1 Tax=Geobacillus sp. (strain Y412MC10) TaxID=481743 RepID=UPI0011AB891D|nr:DNA cytosine methyltransferase [Paenibacillus sp. Y412MC10]
MNREIIHQSHRKTTYSGERIYIDNAALAHAGFTPGARFRTTTDVNSHTVEFEIDSHGANMVSKKVKKETSIPVIDKMGSDIRAALKECAQIKVTFVQDRVIIEGIKQSADVLKEIHEIKEHTALTTISFCAGAGISSQCMVDAGFSEVAAVEWNPKEGSEHKFSEVYTRNHPDTVMFNMPMQMLQPNDLPYADVWVATLDCTDFSKASNGTKKEYHTMHLFMHLMRLFWGREIADRPMAILLENVPEFEKVAGISLELCLQEEGFFTTRAKLDSLDYGSRTKRERFFMVASIYEGFTFPEATGRNSRSIQADGVLQVDDLEWITAEDSDTLKYFLSREQKGGMTHNHHMTLFDLTTDSYIGTITKSHHKIQPENWIKHPTDPNLYAYLKGEHIRALHGISPDYYLGDSNKMVVESIGQSVCLQTFKAIACKLYAFLSGKVGVAVRSLNNVIAFDQPESKTDNYDAELFSFERSGQLVMF